MTTINRIILTTLFLFSVCYTAHSQVPELINFQAQVDGLTANSAQVIFEIFDAPTGGAQLWIETYPSLPITNGRIQVQLGSQQENSLNPEIFADNVTRFIQITVNGEVLSPRTQFTSIPYAFRAAVADSLSNNGNVVTSFNDISGDVSITPGENILITSDGQSLRIDATAVTTSGGVSSLNTLMGPIVLEGGNNVDITPDGQTLRFDAQGDGVGVGSLNALSGDVSITPGENIVITPDGQNLRIDATAVTTSGGVSSLNTLMGPIVLEGGNNVDITPDGQTLRFDAQGDGVGVGSLNALSGDVSITPGENIVITPDGQNLRIDATAVTSSGGVSSLNTLMGPVVLEGGNNVDITPDGQTLRFDAQGDGVGVGSLNALSGSVLLEGGDNVSITPNGQALRIDAQGDGVGVASLNALSGTISLLEGDNIDISQEGQNLRISSSLSAGSNLTLGPSGSLEIKTASNNDAITMGDFFNVGGSITAHTTNGGSGAQMWGILTGSDPETGAQLRGGSFAAFRASGGENDGSVWIRTNGTSDTNAWGVLSLKNAADQVSIILNGQNGDMTLSGNLAKGSGSFKIDHPLDPTNKYLSHSFVESPDMMNVYNGNIILNEDGEAWVELPEWFETLNTDFRYQLTCVGGYAPVYIAEKIQDNKFKIAGGKKDLEVSWQVTGIRNDPYARLNRIQVEEEKSEGERGSYLHPAAYNQ